MTSLPAAVAALLAITLAACQPMTAAPDSPAPADTPDDPAWSTSTYAWRNRLVVLFANDPDDPSLAEQRHALNADPAGLVERHLVIIEAVGDAVTANGQPVNVTPADLRRQYRVDQDSPFAALLIGKDTGVKLRADRPIALNQLFGTIDAMPMRRSEMREQARTP
ncbi:MAG: DUF4174 domain-containing protein [Planctomycetota bacterium]